MNAPQRVPPNPLVEAAIEFGLTLDLNGPWETNAQGQIILNPPIGYLHANRADKIDKAIRAHLADWRVLPELGLHTSDGIKAPDFSVASPRFRVLTDARGFLLAAPEVCVEIMSPSNTWEEMRKKTALYIAAGATEVWICDDEGELQFFNGAGAMDASNIAPAMPRRID